MDLNILKSPFTEFDIPNKSAGIFFLEKLREAYTDTVILDCDRDMQWSGIELYTKCKDVAAALIMEYGLKRGDVICFCVPNSDTHAIGFISALAAGAVYCALPSSSTYQEILRVVNDTRASYIVCTEDNYGIAAIIFAEVPFVKKIFLIDKPNNESEKYGKCPSIEELLSYDCPDELTIPISRSLKETAVLMVSYEGTDRPKIMKRTNLNMIAIGTALLDSELPIYCFGDIVLSRCFSNIYGLTTLTQTICGGGTVALMKDFSLCEKSLSFIEKYGITSLFLFPSEISFIINNDITKKYDLNSLKNLIYGDGSLEDSVYEKIGKKFQFQLMADYATPETGTAAHTFINKLKSNNINSVGFATRGTEIKIITKDGHSVESNRIGEICIRGPQVMARYLSNDDNANAFTNDGFFKTGDSGYYDSDGQLYIIARIKEKMIINGEIVFPTELQSILMQHPDVNDAAVIGVEDLEGRETPKAFVVIKDEKIGIINEQMIHEYITSKVNPIKHLNGGVIFINKIPKSSSGKIVKNELKRSDILITTL